METYPGELLVGVFPLVFCVDALLAPQESSDQEVTGENENENISSTRGHFDRFLDAMASSLLEEPEGGLFGANADGTFSPSGGKRRSMDDHMMNLFRGEDGSLDSDQEDEKILGGDLAGVTMTPMTQGSYAEGSTHGDMNPIRTRSFSNLSFPRLGREGSMGGAGGNRNLKGTPSKDGSIGSVGGIDTSFAKTLQEGRGFFQRARIVSISSRHGFPPSKDSSGDDNRIREFFLGKTMRTRFILAATKRRPIDGILPSGWLEKHAAALPSVILVVVYVCSHQYQNQQDVLLKETLKNMQMSLAPKRQCTIRIVGLVQEDISTSMAAEWKQRISDVLEGNPQVTLLDIADLKQDAPPSMTLQTLHKTVHDASFRYYLMQARRTKHKLCELGPARGTPLLLPLCIRYCFKVAMFYEFLWNPAKSLRYMIEAYRHVETYYRYLLQQREIASNFGDDDDATGSPKIRLTRQLSNASVDGESDGVEMSLDNEDDLNNLLLNPPAIPDDMVHQCRMLADWLNFKILQTSFTTNSEDGLYTAAAQWQRHVQTFCNPRRSFVCRSDHAYMDWSFVARQRMVASQLLERNPPRALGELGEGNDEIILRCSPWRAYEAAAGALLRLGAEVQKASSSATMMETIVDDMRSRYVGGLDRNGYQPQLLEELKVDHKEEALDCLRRAISFYERDIQKMGTQNSNSTACWNRAGTRMYYLIGGTLLGLERCAEAASYLLKAIKLARGWKGLELTIGKMLIQCYENYTPEDSEYDQPLTSILLDSCFNTDMTSADLRHVLEKIASMNGGETIKWHRECLDEADESLPLSFALTFPSGTHATMGDDVEAILLIKSNLDYAVHVDSLTLLSLAGESSIPSADLMSAKNADEGVGGGITIQRKATIWVSTSIKLPRKLDDAVDVSSSGSENKGAASKGTTSKSTRPRTGGITSAAGARFVSQDEFSGGESRSGNGHWSLKCLGGKSLVCEGIRMMFTPVHSIAATEGKDMKIELVIEKKRNMTETRIKRTPFEEEDYLAPAWMRPLHLPMKLGARCLRVLPPLPSMTVTNLTEDCANGKVLEGTVNRIVLKLTAGQQEDCKNVGIKFSCISFLVSSAGDLSKIASDLAQDEEEATSAVDPNIPHVRTPVLVREDKYAPAQMTKYGYEIPKGWVLACGDGQGTMDDEYSTVSSVLSRGDETYAAFDVFRPSPHVTRVDGVAHPGDDEEGFEYERSLCRSDIYISIRYWQDRPAQKPKGIATKRRGRKQEEGSESPVDEPDLVTLTQTVSLVWNAPLSASFSPGLRTTHPSGNRHPSNVLPDSSTRSSTAASTASELVLVDKERVTVKCSVEAAAAADGLMADVEAIRFEDIRDENSPCTFDLLSGKDGSGLLYRAGLKDPCRKLVFGSRFSLAWTSEVNMKRNYLKGSVSASLGTLSVDWSPISLEVPKQARKLGNGGSIAMHGPLKLDHPSTCRFMGPPCYIENAPFEAIMDRIPDQLEVATAFDIVYHIRNKTSLDQKLRISLKGLDPSADESLGFIISGLVNGEISLGPFETHTLSYTALATRSGNIEVPPMCISSDRYKTWLVHEQGQNRTLFVAP